MQKLFFEGFSAYLPISAGWRNSRLRARSRGGGDAGPALSNQSRVQSLLRNPSSTRISEAIEKKTLLVGLRLEGDRLQAGLLLARTRLGRRRRCRFRCPPFAGKRDFDRR